MGPEGPPTGTLDGAFDGIPDGTLDGVSEGGPEGGPDGGPDDGPDGGPERGPVGDLGVREPEVAFGAFGAGRECCNGDGVAGVYRFGEGVGCDSSEPCELLLLNNFVAPCGSLVALGRWGPDRTLPKLEECCMLGELGRSSIPVPW